MQAAIVDVYVIGLGRVEFNDAFRVIPKEAFDVSHFFPCWNSPAVSRYRDVFPASVLSASSITISSYDAKSAFLWCVERGHDKASERVTIGGLMLSQLRITEAKSLRPFHT